MKPDYPSIRERNEVAKTAMAAKQNRIKRILKGLDSPNTGVSSTAIKDGLKLLLRELQSS